MSAPARCIRRRPGTRWKSRWPTSTTNSAAGPATQMKRGAPRTASRWAGRRRGRQGTSGSGAARRRCRWRWRRAKFGTGSWRARRPDAASATWRWRITPTIRSSCFSCACCAARATKVSRDKWSNPSPADAKILLARPLLNLRKTELRDFALAEEIEFREDASNATLDPLRNRIRLEVLPLLRQRGQAGFERAVLRCMEVARAEAEFDSRRQGAGCGRAVRVSPGWRRRCNAAQCSSSCSSSSSRRILN